MSRSWGIVTVLMTGMLLASCAKEKEYETVHIDDPRVHQSKQLIQDMCTLEDPCVYVPSVADTPYNVAASRPYWQGEQKLVVGKVTENELKFLQIEEDERFNSNINNFSPVLSFGIEHLDYKCKEDSYGDCTNAEEEDDEKPWAQRRFVEIDLGGFEVQETNSLPIQFSELFEAGCFSATNQQVTSIKIEKDALNLGIKKTYSAGAGCVPLREMSDLRYLTFTVDYKYSIVKLSSLKDKNYSVVNYPSRDESYFGFFKSEIKTKTVDNLDHVMGIRKTIMNRWSPNKSEVVYFLNDEFYKPEHKMVLDSTLQGIESVNRSLEMAGAKFKITIKDGRKEDIGDLRNNFIIMVKDPQASGVIGYGPSVTNPKTGEIVNARTVMYYGTIKKFMSRAYDELVEEVLTNAAQVSGNSDSGNGGATDRVGSADSMMMATTPSNAYAMRFNNFYSSDLDSLTSRSMDYFTSVFTDFADEQVDMAKVKRTLESKRKELDLMARQTFFHASNVNFDGAVISALGEQIALGQKPKFWDQLSEEERAAIIKILMPHVWVPTLVHEFGHNLGLRHNFSGSADEENYYSSDERRALGMRKKVTYSSIMDYAYRNNNELPVMGKYDVAALRFAYNRSVEDAKGKMVKVETTLKELTSGSDTKPAVLVKKYKYCSDEHVANNPLCNRFDEGTSFEAVAKHYASAFTKNYSKTNFRGRRYSFEGRGGDFNYVLRLFNTFGNLRQFFEIYDQKNYDGSYDDPNWKDNKALVDIKKGSDLVFDFFMNVLEEPAYHCIELDKKTGRITKIAPFGEMAKGTQMGDQFGITFDIRFGCMFLNHYGREGMAYLEFGKYFNNSLDLTVDREQIMSGDTSQIDVRGNWMDKSIATLFLSSRFKSPTTIGASSSGNFLDYPEYRKRFMKLANGVLSNSFTKEVIASDMNGNKYKVPMTYGFDSNHMINKSYNWIVNAFFGLNDNRTNFKNVMMSVLKSKLKEATGEGDLERDDSMFSRFDLDRVSTKVDLSRYNYDKVVEFKSSNDVVTYRFGLYNYNEKGVELAKLKAEVDTMEENKTAVKEALTLIASETEPTEETSEAVKEMLKLGEGKLTAFAEGRLSNTVLLRSFIALSK
jgi:hypothetical protein